MLRSSLFALATTTLFACSTSGLDANTADGQGAQQAIIGGQLAAPGQFEHQVSLQDARGNHFCGGSILDDEWILTAAHCLQWHTADTMMVEVGTNTIGEGVAFAVAELVSHEGYFSNDVVNDVALVRVEGGGLKAHGTAIPLVDPASESLHATPGTTTTVSGWGALDLGELPTDELNYVDLPLVDHKACGDHFGGWIDDGMVCAGYLNSPSESSCQGDSGGPLVIETPAGTAQLGVVSFGVDCGQAGFPSVYASVPHFLDWVQQRVPSVRIVSEGAVDDTGPPPAPQPEPEPSVPWISEVTVVDTIGATHLNVTMDESATLHTLELVVDAPSVVRLTSSGRVDTLAWWRALDGTLLAEDDNSGLGTNFDLTVTAEPGVTHLDVLAFGSEDQRTYDVVIEVTPL